MIHLWSRATQTPGMDDAMLAGLRHRVRRHPWWQARARLVERWLHRLDVQPPATILDVGCGWGVTLDHLEHAGFHLTGLDSSRAALEAIDLPHRSLVQSDLEADLPLPTSRQWNAILLLDVLEHLAEPAAALQRLSPLLAPGGLLIVSVPALPELWSEFDEIQGHHRRYTPDSLRATLEAAHLQPASIHWWGQWMVPLLARRRSRRRARPGEPPATTYARYVSLPPWPASTLMSACFAREQRPTLEGRLTSGTSLFAIARQAAPSDQQPRISA